MQIRRKKIVFLFIFIKLLLKRFNSFHSVVTFMISSKAHFSSNQLIASGISRGSIFHFKIQFPKACLLVFLFQKILSSLRGMTKMPWHSDKSQREQKRVKDGRPDLISKAHDQSNGNDLYTQGKLQMIKTMPILQNHEDMKQALKKPSQWAPVRWGSIKWTWHGEGKTNSTFLLRNEKKK